MDNHLNLSAVFITYQCKILDYCIEETIRGCLDGLCSSVYINDGGSTDGTLELLESLEREYGKDRLVLFKRKWTHDRGFWARERNFLLEQIPKDHFVLNLGADESIHENYFEDIHSVLPNLNGRALQFNAVHFYGTPDYTISGPAWSCVLTKIWHNSAGIIYLNRPGGCADDPIWPGGAPVHFMNCVNVGIPVFHYGHCRHPKAVGIKNKKADSLYRSEKKYADGTFPVIKQHDYRLEHFISTGGAKKFEGTHPKSMMPWIDRHKNQPTCWREV